MNAATANAIAQLFTLAGADAPTPTNVQSYAASLAPLLATIASDTTLPSAVTQGATAAIPLATALSATITKSGVSTSTIQQNLSTAVSSLLVYALAAQVATDVSVNGCGGYSQTGVSNFQTQDGTIKVTGIYDATTAARVSALLGSTAPAACTTAPSPAPGPSTSSSGGTNTVAIVAISALALGTLGVLMYQKHQATPVQGIRRRR